MKNRHAYLIMAHHQFYILERLIKLLDFEWNDIFIHVDKKVKDFNFSYYQSLTKKSKVFYVERVDVRWGDISQIKTELTLFKEAYKYSNERNYSFFHLISGVDLPIKPVQEIYNFYELENKDFIGYLPINNASKRRYQNYHIFTKYIKNKSKILNIFFDIIRESYIMLQKLIKFNRSKDLNIQFGPNWVDLKKDTVGYILSNENEIYKTYSHMRCADEFYKQTLIYNNPKIYSKIYKSDDAYEQCKRLIDWKRGRPYVWRTENFGEIINSDRMFARKFDINIDRNVVDKLFEQISEKNIQLKL